MGACSCSHSIRPMAVPGPAGPVVLDSRGVFAGEGDGFRKIPAEGITQLQAINGEVWGTCDQGCGARRLLLGPERGLTKRDGLLDDRVSRMVSPTPGVTFFSYDPKLDLGVSVLSGTVWTHYSAYNSALASGRVAELVSDALGGVWVKFKEERMGVARIFDGRAVNFTSANSALPYDTVEIVAPEPPDRGLSGHQVWLATVDGLTRFDLGTSEWKHYGRRHGDATDFLRMTGLDSLFGRAVTGINGIAFTGSEAWISTRSGLFRFDADSFHPVPADFTGGMEKLCISSIASSGEVVWVSLENIDSRKQEAVASWTSGNKWRIFRLDDFAIRAPGKVYFSPIGDGLFLQAPEWGGQILVSHADGFQVVNINPDLKKSY